MAEGKPLLPPAYFAIAIVVMVLLHFVLPIAVWLNSPWGATGVVLILIGLGFNVVADRQFKRYGTTIKPLQPSTALVTEGLFGISRNPMYLGMVLVLFGIAVMLGTVSPLVVIPVFTWWITVRFIVPEEQHLNTQFGRTFTDYRSKVRRWL